MLGSLESATKRTLMMSPSALDTSANSANMYRSTVPSEQILTIAQLEEKSKEERSASVSGGTTPCKLESMDSSSSSSSSTISQDVMPVSCHVFHIIQLMIMSESVYIIIMITIMMLMKIYV